MIGRFAGLVFGLIVWALPVWADADCPSLALDRERYLAVAGDLELQRLVIADLEKHVYSGEEVSWDCFASQFDSLGEDASTVFSRNDQAGLVSRQFVVRNVSIRTLYSIIPGGANFRFRASFQVHDDGRVGRINLTTGEIEWLR